MRNGPTALPISLRNGETVDADDLRIGPLFAALQEMNLPGITAEMGKHDLLRHYRNHLDSIRAEKISEARQLVATANGRGGQ
jgi:hypothetical protein